MVSIFLPFLYTSITAHSLRVVRLVVLGVGLAHQRVAANLHLVAEAHLLLFVLIERQPGKADDDEDDAEVHQISAVTARVAARDRTMPCKMFAPVCRAMTRPPRQNSPATVVGTITDSEIAISE